MGTGFCVTVPSPPSAGWGPVGVSRGTEEEGRTGKVSGYFLLLSFCLAHWWAGGAMIRPGKGR